MAVFKLTTLPKMLHFIGMQRWDGKQSVSVGVIISDVIESCLMTLDLRLVKLAVLGNAMLTQHRLLIALKQRNRTQVKTEFITWFVRFG